MRSPRVAVVLRAPNRTALRGMCSVGLTWPDRFSPMISGMRSLLPPPRLRPKSGRRPIANRSALTGILFVLRSGLPWEMLPAEMGCGSGMSCWRRLRDWQAAGVWSRQHHVLLERLHAAGEIDWRRACRDSAFVPAKKGGLPPARTRRTGVSRGRSATLSPTRAARRSASA